MSVDTVTVRDLELLADHLEATELDDQQRRTLGALFLLAGRALADPSPEVEGFMPTAVERVVFTIPTLPGSTQPGSTGALLPAVKTQDNQLIGLLHTGNNSFGEGGGAG